MFLEPRRAGIARRGRVAAWPRWLPLKQLLHQAKKSSCLSKRREICQIHLIPGRALEVLCPTASPTRKRRVNFSVIMTRLSENLGKGITPAPVAMLVALPPRRAGRSRLVLERRVGGSPVSTDRPGQAPCDSDGAKFQAPLGKQGWTATSSAQGRSNRC